MRPVAAAPRHLPPAIQPQVLAKIHELEEGGIIEKVTHFTKWCSPIVIARKSNGDIRLCTDLRKLNEAVKRQLF